MRMAKKIKLITVVCGVMMLSIALMGCSSSNTENSNQESLLVNELTDKEEVVYTLYFGLIDKDTGKQEMSVAASKEALVNVFLEAGSGYTIYEAEGGYVNDAGDVVQNTTLVCTGIHGSAESVIKLVEKAQTALNVESVYCESALLGNRLYGGVMTEVG